MKKISKFLLLSAFFAGMFGVALQKDKAPVKVEAATSDRLIYLDKGENAGWWVNDDTNLHYYNGSADVHLKMDKVDDRIFTIILPGSVLDSGGGFRFFVFNREKAQHQTNWNNATTIRDNGHNYFTLKNPIEDNDWQTTTSSLYGDTVEVTKYRGATVIGTDEVLKSENYTPSFVYQQGYKLEGWYTDAGLTTPYVVGELTSDISLYGKYVAAEDYYVYFRKPDDWGSNINAYYYYEGEGIPLGCQCENWPGDPMTEVMGGGHGYVVKVDAGYSPNMIIFNDVVGDDGNQTQGTPLVAGKVYTFIPDSEENPNPGNIATAHDFEYRLFKSWAPWDDQAEDFADNYVIGNGVEVAIKAGDSVKMNISSHIYAPSNKLSGPNVATHFEADPDDNYKALVSGVYKFTYNEEYALGAATETKTAQISADNSTIDFEVVTVENNKIAAVDQRLADINTCAEYDSHGDYVDFVTDVLGVNGMTLISEANQAKLALMSRYIVTPPPAIGGSMANDTRSASLNVVLIIGLLGLTTLAGFYFLQKKKYS